MPHLEATRPCAMATPTCLMVPANDHTTSAPFASVQGRNIERSIKERKNTVSAKKWPSGLQGVSIRAVSPSAYITQLKSPKGSSNGAGKTRMLCGTSSEIASSLAGWVSMLGHFLQERAEPVGHFRAAPCMGCVCADPPITDPRPFVSTVSPVSFLRSPERVTSCSQAGLSWLLRPRYLARLPG